MKDIGIITYHRVYNYGAALQAYATIECFKKIGVDAEIIDYIPKKVQNYGSFRQIFYETSFFHKSIIKRILISLIKMPVYKAKRPVFDSFIEEYIPLSKSYYSEGELKKAKLNYKCLCTGSDQVWNNLYLKSFDFVYFLSFVDNVKKIAFSASFGKKHLSDIEIETIKPYLCKYCAISVREKSGLDLLKNINVPIKDQTLDPTMVLNRADWKKLIGNNKQGNYVLVYQLHRNSHTQYFGKLVAEKLGLKVVVISDSCNDKVFNWIKNPDIKYFLELFYYADFIITDSFHGTAFSLNFNKDFIVTSPQETGERIKSILEITCLMDRAVCSESDVCIALDKKIDYDKVNALLDAERGKTIAYLKMAIGC